MRIEDSIDKQQALMEQGFGQMKKRFEQADKRLEQLRIDTNARFDETRADMNARFDQLHKQNQRQTSILALLIGTLTLMVAYGSFMG